MGNRRVSFAVTFLDGRPIMTLYAAGQVADVIAASGVRAVVERITEWSGGYDDRMGEYDVAAHVGPMSPDRWMARYRAGDTGKGNQWQT